MLKTLKSMLTELLPEETVAESPNQLKELAAAALMVEVASIDDDFDADELAILAKEIQQQFGLSGKALQQLIEQASSQSNDATSLYQFTRCVNDELSNREKLELVTGMWRVAYADGDLDRYEEHIIRRIADLIHVSHSQFIRAKQLAKDPR